MNHDNHANGRVTAFVMLDEETAPQGQAANDPA